MLKHIPNLLTSLRILLAPCFAALFLAGFPNEALLVFLLGSLTDVLDGFIARRFHCITTVGMALDPLADKLTLICTLACLYSAGRVPLWLLLVLTAREMLMVLGGAILWQHKLTFGADHFGKITTLLFFSAAALLFPWHAHAPLIRTGNVLLLLSLASSALSFLHYLRRYQITMTARQFDAK